MTLGKGCFLVGDFEMDGLAAREFLRNFRRWRRHSRAIRFLIAVGVPRSLGIDPFVNLFAGSAGKIDEAHTGAFFRFSNPADFTGSFDGFEGARKLKTEE